MVRALKGCTSGLGAGRLRTKCMNQSKAIPKTRDCEHCGRTIVWKSFRQHERTCLSGGQKRYKCIFEDCFAFFKTPKERNHHSKTTHESPVKCEYEGCDALIKPNQLSRHILTAHNKVKKKCDICNKELSARYYPEHVKICHDKNYWELVKCSIIHCGTNIKTRIKNKLEVACKNCKERFEPCRFAEHIGDCNQRIYQMEE